MVCINKHFSKCSFPEFCSKMFYLLNNFYFDTESLYIPNKNICCDCLIPSHGRKGGKESRSSGINPNCFLFFLTSGAFQSVPASLLYGCVTVRDDNRICWECGPLLYPPYVTTWSDGNG